MYTENTNYDDEYYEEENNNYSNNDKKGLIIKIVIILICVIILILLIASLRKNNNNTAYDPSLHASNVEKVRLGAEDYFFIKGNMPKNNEIKKVTLEELIKEGLVTEIVDANKKTCNDLKTIATLNEDGNVYVLRISLSCSTNENEEVFYYNKDTYACLNCNGKTKMDGKKDDKEDVNKNNNQESNTSKNDYNCTDWSSWTSERVNSTDLKERTRTLYLGVKEGKEEEVVTYSEWSDYTKTPINATKDIEVEIKVEVEKDWGIVKTSNSPVQESETVKLLGTSTTGGGSYTYCPSGYKKDSSLKKCVSETSQNGDLTYNEYVSGNYVIYNKPCDALNTERGKGLVYKNCKYSKVIDLKTGSSSGSTVYNYQEMEDVQVMYYRYRTKKVDLVKTVDEYTKEYYEEDKMPSGYTKKDDTAKTEYSYMLKTCVK